MINKMMRLTLCVFLCTISVIHGGHEKYEGHQLYTVAGDKEAIRSLEAKLDLLSLTPGIRTSSGKLEALVRLSPEARELWLQHFEQNNMSYTKVADNLADILRREEALVQQARINAKQSGRSITWDTYYRYEEINNHLDQIGAAYPDVVTIVNAGLSYEGRQIKYAQISTSRFQDASKPVIIIDAMVHAREWVTTPVALYIINQLVVNVVDKKLTEEIDWIIIPLANPDGYEYTMDKDRLWRKTRSRNHTGSDVCPGVDGNRNFDHYWGTSESSADPCAIIYEGPSAFSEPEIQIIRNVVLAHIGRAALYISLHSYGNMFLYAWGNNATLPANGEDLHTAGEIMAETINELALEKADRYVTGNAAQILYYTTGTSRDWTRAAGIPLTYTLELPGYEYLFEVPPEYVQQIVHETWAGIAAGANHILSSSSFIIRPQALLSFCAVVISLYFFNM